MDTVTVDHDAMYQEMVERLVAHGVRYLDEYGPRHWRRRVHPGRLDVAHPTRCVLGQLYGHFAAGAERLGLGTQVALALGLYVPMGIDIALIVVGGRDLYQDLTEEWRRQLALAA